MTLRADGVLGVLRPSASGCGGAATEVGLWGPSWSTGHLVGAQVEPGDDGVTWLRFPINTGLGAAEMVLRLQGRDVVLPLGGRPGEFDITLDLAEGLPEDAVLEAARTAAEAAVEQEAAAWQEGSFLLMDRDTTVGEVRFMGASAPPMVSVHDVEWLTPEPVPAARRDDGGDVLLEFVVEPSLESETALIRINALTRQVSVPTGPVPDATLDRTLRMEPGGLSADERDEAVRVAMERADAMEGRLLDEQLPFLLRAAREADCAPLESLGEPWTLVFRGYDVDLSRSADGVCRVNLTPEFLQHRRRVTRTYPQQTE